MCVKLCNNTTSMCFNDVLWCIQLFGLYGLIKESKPMWLSSDWTFEICIPDIHQLFMVSYIVHNIYIYIYIIQYYIYIYCLVVSTPLKNISQLGWLFPIYGKIKKCSKPPTKYTYDYIHILGISPIIAAACLKTRRRATFCKLRPRKSEFLHDEGFKIFNRGLFDFICFRQLITFQYILRVLPRTNQRFMMGRISTINRTAWIPMLS